MHKTNKRKFDFIFLDPPFDQIKYENLLRAIDAGEMLCAEGKIFLESNKHTELELSSNRKVLKEKIIGDVRLMILQ